MGCMYVATGLGTLIGLVILGLLNGLLFFPENIMIGKIVSLVLAILLILNAVLSPYLRFHRYRYAINEECIDIVEGYVFVTRDIVPIERLHKLQTAQGPIDRIFKVAKVNVTTAGGDVTIRFLEKEKAEMIADQLKHRINEIVTEQKQEDGVQDGEE